MSKEALKLALEALRMPSNYWNKTQFIKVKEAIAAAEEALAQPDPYASEEESNALIQPDTRTPEQKKADKLADKNWMNEQGVEPQRTWVGLTDREKSNLWLESRAAIPRFHTYARLVEAKLKEKNT